MMNSTVRQAILRACSVSIFAGLFTGLSSQAAPPESRSFRIETHDAATALTEFGQQAGAQILFPYDLVQGHTVNPVIGDYEPLEALRLLLKDSGLQTKEQSKGVYMVEAVKTEPSLTRSDTSGPALRLAQTAARSTAETSVLEEVIVTAQKREEKLQDVPIAITAMTAADLARKGITSFAGVTQATPSITVVPYNNSSNTLTVYMRGLGFIDPGQITADGAVGLYEDGFYISRPQASTFDLADVERVEVLRGPQGTLYGRNTTGGAVNLISKAPTGEFAIKEVLDFGNRNMYRSLTTVDLPQWGEVAAKVTLLKSGIDGYVKNIGSSRDYGEEQQQAGRVQLRWQPAAGFRADYFFEKGAIDSTPIYYQSPAFNGLPLFDPATPYFSPSGPATRTYRPVDLALSTSKFDGQGLTLTWDANEALTVKSLTGYRQLKWEGFQDYVEVFGLPYAGQDLYHSHQFSQEVQFLGNLWNNSVKYVAGLYYFNEGGTHFQVYDIAGFIPVTLIDMRSKSKAVFGQVTWTPGMLERLDLTLGARYTQDDKSASRVLSDNFSGVTENGAATGSVNNLKFSRFNPAFSLAYHLTDEINSYAKISTGYKAGGSLESAPPGAFTHTFGPENVKTYELGLKSYWFDHRLRANAAVFDTRLKGLQLFLGADPAATYFQAYNAGNSTMKGVELELQASLTEDLSVNLNYTYLNARIDRINVIAGTTLDSAINPASPYKVGDNVKNLFTMPYAPKNSLDVGIDYAIAKFTNGALSASADYRRQSRVYATAPAGPGVLGRDLASIPAYGTFNARLTLDFDLPSGDRASVSLWGKNITNKKYYQSDVATGGVGPVPIQTVDPATGDLITSPAGYFSRGVAWSQPPAYGVSLTYRYK